MKSYEFCLHSAAGNRNGKKMALWTLWPGPSWPYFQPQQCQWPQWAKDQRCSAGGNIKQTSREGRPPHNWKRAQEGNSSTLKFWSSRSSCSPGMEKTKISRVRRLNALVPGCLVDQVHSGWIWKSWSKLAILRCPEPRQRKDHIERLVWRYVTLQLWRRQSPFGGESLRTPPRPTLGWC